MNLFVFAAAATTSLGLSAGVALAVYPEKPITMVVSLAAGGNADIGATDGRGCQRRTRRADQCH